MQKVEEDLNFELEESDIAFDPVPPKKEGSNKKFMALSSMQEQSAEPLVEKEDVKAVEKENDERLKAIITAKKRYDRQFYEQFAFKGAHSELMTQRALENYIAQQKPEDVELIVLSMINSAYEINDIIPNIELMFYKIFCSPITTKDLRKAQDKDDILAGNLFAVDGIKLPNQAYVSLLQTVALIPKKKHFKKIIEHLISHNDPADVEPQLIDLLNYIGIE